MTEPDTTHQRPVWAQAGTCRKRCYLTDNEAHQAARIAARKGFGYGWKTNTYKCDTCRDETGRRAWHWRHRRPRAARAWRRV